MNKAISVSRIREFDECPHRFKLTHIDGLKYAIPPYFTIGKNIHAIMEEKITEAMKNGESVIDFGVGNVNEETPFSEEQDILRKVTLVLPDYIKAWGVEERKAYKADWTPCDWDDEAVAFRGIIDAWFLTDHGMLTLFDFKTSYRIETQAEVQDCIQMKTYALFKSMDFPEIEYITAEKHFLRKNTLVDAQFFAPEIVKSMKKYLSKKYKEINEETEFKPRVGAQCVNCLVSEHCDEYQKAVGHTRELKSAESMLEWTYLAEAKVKKYKDILKAKTEKVGAITHKGITAKFRDSIQDKIDTQGFISLTRQMEIPETEVLSRINITKGEAKEILYQTGNKSKLADIPVTKKTVTKFEIKKEEE